MPSQVGKWAYICQSCNYRVVWQGEISARPKCPKCFPPAKTGFHLSGDGDWETAIEQCDRILETCDEIPERGEDFANSVREQVQDVRDWIEEYREVTERQQQSLDNWESGVGRWIR